MSVLITATTITFTNIRDLLVNQNAAVSHDDWKLPAGSSL